MTKKLAAVILAAGQGTRMKSQRPKVLHPVVGRPMLSHVVKAAGSLGAAPIIPVIGHGAEQVRQALAEEPLTFALQEEQLGTGHALLCAEDSLKGFTGDLLLLCGDVPLLRVTTLRELLQHHQKTAASVTILTAQMQDPTGYGRIIRGENGVERIVEEKDASSNERLVDEINTGAWLMRSTPVSTFFVHRKCLDSCGDSITAMPRGNIISAAEAMGINDRVQLSEAGAIMRQRINEGHQRAGVTLIDPATTYIEPDVVIGADTLLHPNVHLRGMTTIGSGCEIEPGVVVTDCSIADQVHLKPGSVLSESSLGDSCAVGPMAHLRPGTVLSGNNKVGVNIGCGTITCNYDGVNKHQTTIGDDVFVGSDTQFVAPVTIGRGSLIGAGSTITKDVPEDALAITRAEQKNVAGWAIRNRKKLSKKSPK
jgi:bifunctional UDP-N-acetylglucosamine pyrophosphorylase/glucosamine-1-phosphate N-acetyltransferase